MRLCDLTTLWAATPVTGKVDFESVTAYTNLRVIKANLQTDTNELDLQQYGQTARELIKLRADTPLSLLKGDRLYLQQPQETGAILLNGITCAQYGPGDYVVESIQTGYWGRKGHNPCTATAKAVV